MLIKKYGNRRLYDTDDSRYITLEELTEKIRAGNDVRVVDAKTNKDLTQATLTQIVIESRDAAKLLPVPLLLQLVRLSDDALAEFFGRYVSTALDLYVQAKQGARAVAPYNPFAMMPFDASSALARMFGAPAAWASEAPPPQYGAPPAPARSSEMDELRRELDDLKRSLRKRRK